MSKRKIVLLTIVISVVIGIVTLSVSNSYQFNSERPESKQIMEDELMAQQTSAEGKHYEITLSDKLQFNDEVSTDAHRVITITENLGLSD